VHVTRDDAEAYAKWAGGRLPTEAEWEFAARESLDGETLSWLEAEHAELSAKANVWQGIFPVIDRGDDGYVGIAPVGQYPANPLGLFDMIGNVWEWTDTPYAPSHSERDRDRAATDGLDPSQPGIPVGTIKGGSYLCASNYCRRFRPAARQAQDLAFGTSHIGFRIAR
jgi:sulfatase modifying factor 1